MQLSIISSTILIVLSATTAVADKNFAILHNGNMRSVYDEIKYPTGMVGSFSRLHSLIQKRKEESPTKVFYFNTGNAFAEGFFTQALGSTIFSDVINMLTPDAVAVSLRAFSVSTLQLQEFMKSIQTPVICCNVNFTSDLNIQKHITITMGSVTVVVIGYVSTKVNHFPSEFKATNPIVAIRETIQNIDAPNKLVIVLGSSDLDTEKKIAYEVDGVNIIIGDGELPVQKDYPILVTKRSKRVFIIRSQGGTDTVGYFKASLNDRNVIATWTGDISNLAHEAPGSKAATDMLLKFRSNLMFYDSELIARSRVNLSAECSQGECNLGNMVADAFVEYMANKYEGPYWTDTPIALVNAASIRTGIDIDKRNGEITRADVLSILPYYHYLVSFTIPGEEIYNVLEQAMRNSSDEDDFIQVSGLRIFCNTSMPTGYKVQLIKARCGECNVPVYDQVDSDQFYRIVTNDFLAKGGDNYAAYKIKGTDVVYENVTDVDVVLSYVQKYRIVSSEVSQRLGSITFLAGSDVSANLFLVVVTVGVVGMMYFYK